MDEDSRQWSRPIESVCRMMAETRWLRSGPNRWLWTENSVELTWIVRHPPALAAMSVRPFIKRHRYRENTLKVAVRLLRSLETMRHIVGDRNACEFGSQFGLARLKANEQTGQADGS